MQKSYSISKLSDIKKNISVSNMFISMQLH